MAASLLMSDLIVGLRAVCHESFVRGIIPKPMTMLLGVSGFSAREDGFWGHVEGPGE